MVRRDRLSVRDGQKTGRRQLPDFPHAICPVFASVFSTNARGASLKCATLVPILGGFSIHSDVQPGDYTVAKKTSTATATKSDVIRDVLKSQPTATVGEIKVELKRQGVKASDALVNKIK